MLYKFAFLLLLMGYGSLWVAASEGYQAVPFQTIKRGIIENYKHKGELLFPYDKELVKRKSFKYAPEVKSTGRVMAEFASENPPNYNKWIFMCKSDIPDICKIYNEGMGGYLNAYDMIHDRHDYQRRDVFVSNDREDNWQIIKHPNIENAVAFKNLPTNEFLFAIVSERGQQPYLNYFPEQTERSVYLWKFASMRELYDDPHSFWYFKTNEES